MNAWEIKNIVFQQICDRIIEKECVPFLGRGISVSAKIENGQDSCSKNEKNTVQVMKKALSTNIRPDKSLGEFCEEFLWKQNGGKELKELVEKLQIVKMCELKPTIFVGYENIW